MLTCVCMTAAGFISGSVMYSYIVPKLLQKIDIRELSEDGNPGSMNAINAAGTATGLVCLALDVLKAFVPVFVSVAMLGVSGGYLIPVVAAPVLGHAFSPFLRFRGGKAVAASFGALLGIMPVSSGVLILAFMMIVFKFIIIITPDSSKVIAAYVLSSVAFIAMEPLMEIRIAALVISFIVCCKHCANPNKEKLSVRIGRLRISYSDRKILVKKG